MRVLVVGSNTVGGFIGSRLIERNIETTFVVQPARQRQLITRGLIVQSQFGRFRRPVRAILPQNVAGHSSIVVIAVRAFDFERALAIAAPAIGPETLIVPVIEGFEHTAYAKRTPSLRWCPAVFEGRMRLDADGVITHTSVPAELAIGALEPGNVHLASELGAIFVGRGLKTLTCDDIEARAFARFAFMAAAVATSALYDCPLADARFFAGGSGAFENLLRTGERAAVALGLARNIHLLRGYRTAYLQRGRPVDPPVPIAWGGRAGDESAALLGEMICTLRAHIGRCGLYESAWHRVVNASQQPRVSVRALSA